MLMDDDELTMTMMNDEVKETKSDSRTLTGSVKEMSHG